ncbi:MAG: NAD(P)H-hydrate dehydratase [Cyclobacteriaceae bacterium]
MKILSATQIRQADQHTIENEPIKSIDLMERASKAFLQIFLKKVDVAQKILVVCGTGNNGGDGLAISRLLAEEGFVTSVFIIGNSEKGTSGFQTNLKRLKEVEVNILSTLNVDQFDIIIDGIFGSGLSRKVEGQYAEVINRINSSKAFKFSIDIPSGLFCDSTTAGGVTVQSDETISFQAPKLAFFLPENGAFVKSWNVVDIGLNQSYINSISSKFETIERGRIISLLTNRPKFFHKGNAGRALLVSGSKGKIGAAILAAKACLRSGVGLLTVHCPEIGNVPLQSAVPEAMLDCDVENDFISSVKATDHIDVIGIGPGIGTRNETKRALRDYLERLDSPLVIDADALNILSEEPSYLELLPANCILTPHPGEFKRLVGEWADDFERLKKQKELSKKHNVIVILKNAHTSVTQPDGTVFFNTTGNPGMATAGSGDVLTGMLTGFLAQGMPPGECAIAGTFIHGMAGDLARDKFGERSLIATDIIDNIPEALLSLKF